MSQKLLIVIKIGQLHIVWTLKGIKSLRNQTQNPPLYLKKDFKWLNPGANPAASGGSDFPWKSFPGTSKTKNQE